MLPVLVTAVFLLTAAGVYLVLHRSLLKLALGLSCMSHAVHLVLLASGRWGPRAPIVGPGMRAADASDPVPQAFVLTAIVISMAFTLYLLAGMVRQARWGGAPELAAPPESDADPSSEEVGAELAGRGPGG